MELRHYYELILGRLWHEQHEGEPLFMMQSTRIQANGAESG